MSRIKRFLLNRLDERSTWRAIVALLTLAGIGLDPEQSEAIIAAGIAIGAALEALLPEPAGKIRAPKPEPSPSVEPAADPHRLRNLPDQARDSRPTADRRSAVDGALGPWRGTD
jgi:hypothetical protein